MRCAVISLGRGNLGSLVASLKRLGAQVVVWQDPEDVGLVDWVIFPGVGALGGVTQLLQRQGLLDPLQHQYQSGQPMLGICLGMQLWFGEGEEGGRGLGWMEGTVPGLRAPILPHIGWNQLEPTAAAPRWVHAFAQRDFYFVHRYCVQPDDVAVVTATSQYGQVFPSMVMQGSLVGVQFHPELSGDVGEGFLAEVMSQYR